LSIWGFGVLGFWGFGDLKPETVDEVLKTVVPDYKAEFKKY